MGSSCSKDSSPDLSDQCSSATAPPTGTVNVNDTSYSYKVPNYCGDTSICDQIGSGTIPAQKFNGFGESVPQQEDCCDGTSRIYCLRSFFPGDPGQCCLQSYDLNKIPQNCFTSSSSNGPAQACDPLYRNIVGTGCENLFTSVCVTSPKTDAEFFAAWNNSSFCPQTIIKHTTTPTNAATAQQNKWANDQVALLFGKYFSTVETGIQGPATAESFQSTLYNFCLANPAACQTALTTSCVNYTAADYAGNVNVSNFCGCHTNVALTTLYTDLYGIDASCMPSCSRFGTIPSTDSTGAPIKCQGNICIIDNVTITLANSEAGNISFGQFCSGCGSSSGSSPQGASAGDGTTGTVTNTSSTSCSCIISNVTISAAEADLGNINLAQACGNPTCVTTTATGEKQVVDCITGQPSGGSLPTPNPQPPPGPTPAPAPPSSGVIPGTNITPTTAFIIAGVVLFVFILLIILFLIFG